MVELVLTNTLDSNFILKKLKENYGKGGKHLVIVPDRIVLSYEMLIMDYLDIEGTFDIEVVSFSRLADLLLAKKAKTMLNKQTEIMLIRKTIEDNKKDLVYYKNSVNYVGFANEIQNIISAIRQNNISVEDVEKLKEVLPKKFQNKTQDILLIYRKYIQKLTEGTFDSNSKIEALVEIFKDSVYANYNIYLSEFMSFSQIELNVVEEFVKNCPKVFIGLPYSKEENGHIFPIEFVRKIENIAKQCEQRIVICEDNEPLDIEFEAIRKNLFSYKHVGGKIVEPKVEIYEVSDQEKEVKQFALAVKKLIKQKNIRYKDIACVCCDLKNYLPTIQATFNKYEIPYYMDIKTMLQNQLIAKLLINAVKIITNGYLQIDVFAFINECTVLFDKNEINQFENYCLKHGIEFKDRFKREFVYGDENTAKQMTVIQNKLLGYLAPLEDNCSKTSCEHVAVIREFLAHIKADEICEKFARQQEETGYKVDASATRQSYRKILDILLQIETILKDTEMDFAQFAKILETTIASQEISTIPMYIDCVYIGDCEKSRYEKKKYMFVIGANDQFFPNEKNAQSLLSLQEYVEWNKRGYPLYPNASEINKNERLNALMVLLKPKDGLVISYPKYDMLGKQLAPSNVVGYLQNILGVNVNKYSQISNGDNIQDIANRFVTRKSALTELIELKTRIDNNELKYDDSIRSVLNVLYSVACEEYGKNRVDKIINNGYEFENEIKIEGYNAFETNSISVSRLEKYLACPFKYFVEYILHLKERELAGLNVIDTGNILHAIMEEFFRNYYDKNNLLQNVKDIVNEIFEKLTQENHEYIYLKEECYALVRNNLLNIAVNSISILQIKMQKTKFEPVEMEATFGFENSKYNGLKIKIKDKELNLNGKIDRIDKYKDQFLVIDYKSKSSIDFNFKEIVYGKKIQLMVYVDVLMKSGNLTPAGMYYLLLKETIKNRENGKAERLKYTGFTNHDEVVFDALDPNYTTNTAYNSDLYPVEKTCSKDGKISYNGNQLYGKEEFEKGCEYVEKLMIKAANEMQDGYIAPSPLAGECQYCKFKNICGINHKEENKRKTADAKKINFKDYLLGV